MLFLWKAILGFMKLPGASWISIEEFLAKLF